MTPFDTIIRYFERFPGIGSRQAKRFAFHLLTCTQTELDELSSLIQNIRSNVHSCTLCGRFFVPRRGEETCSICGDNARDVSKLTVVERDTDVDAIERGGVYNGMYFVLGGTVPLLESHENKKLRGGMLKEIVQTRTQHGLEEIILAFSVNPDGENTARYVESLLREQIDEKKLRVSYLGRGLSTGSELEYADPETIKNAFKNRS